MTDHLREAHFTGEPVTAVYRFTVPRGETDEP